jgi:hypothetical protein
MGLAPLAAAEDMGPITWLALEKTESGKSRQLIAATIGQDGPMYDEMLANGTLSSWGIAIPINHHLGAEWNYFLWATMDGWGDVQQLQGGFEKMFASQTPEQMAKNQQLYDEATVDGAHHDWIVRHHVHEVTAPGEGPAPKYFHFSYWKAAPQGYEKLIDFYKDQVAPIMAKHKASGAVSSYGITTQELHGDPRWTHITWYTVSELATIDAVGQSLDEGMDDDTIAELMPMMDYEAHWDQVALIVHIGGTSSEME